MKNIERRYSDLAPESRGDKAPPDIRSIAAFRLAANPALDAKSANQGLHNLYNS